MKLGNYQLLANADEVRRRDFQRNAAAAQLATNLATQSQLQLGAQRNAAAMAGQALADIGATTRTQYTATSDNESFFHAIRECSLRA
jgi:hypothetical protein